MSNEQKNTEEDFRVERFIFSAKVKESWMQWVEYEVSTGCRIEESYLANWFRYSFICQST